MSRKTETARAIEAALTAEGWVAHPLPHDKNITRFLAPEGTPQRRDGVRMFVTRQGHVKRGMSPGGALRILDREHDRLHRAGIAILEADS